jgi:hypothetical protein
MIELRQDRFRLRDGLLARFSTSACEGPWSQPPAGEVLSSLPTPPWPDHLIRTSQSFGGDGSDVDIL